MLDHDFPSAGKAKLIPTPDDLVRNEGYIFI